MKLSIGQVTLILFAAGFSLVMSLPARAAGRGETSERGYVYDHRFDHNHYYPQRGYAVGVLPHGYLSVPWHGSSFFFYGGTWYRPYGTRYMVIAPPFGIGIPMLPPGYTTVWVDGMPYYYADGTYYRWQPQKQGYVVAAPPADAAAATTVSPAGEALFAYPRNGQSEAQQSADRYACHDWARSQTGFDPTQPLGGVDAANADNRRADYLRAQESCLEGRGYSVR